MPVGAEVYRPVAEGDPLATGDICLLTLARTRLKGEAPPTDAFDPFGRVPAYPRPALVALPHNREVALDTMFGLVVTHSCEIDRQKNLDVSADHFDCRIGVAPIVPEPAVRLVDASGAHEVVNWTAIEGNGPVAALYLPPIADVAIVAPEAGPEAWPRSFADLRGISTVSRRMVATDRLMSLTPEYVGMLQRQLARFFTWRDLAHHSVVAAMVGRRVSAALPLNTRGDRLRVALTADDGTMLTVEMRAG